MRFLKSCSCALMLLVASFAHAQDSVTETPITADTTFVTTESDSVFIFDRVHTEDIAPINERAIPDSILQRLRTDKAFWYANADFKKKATPNEPQNLSFLQRLLLQEWFRNLLWAIIIGSFVVVLILFLMKSNIRLFHRAPAAINTTGEGFTTENIFSIDYKTEISNAVKAGDFRQAIRLYYLQTLRLLSNRNIIQYKEDFTNSDYLQQLRPTTYYAAFRNITRYFEYTWYGRFNVTPEVFKTIESDFNTFNNSMGI